jgi:hypothetical protein
VAYPLENATSQWEEGERIVRDEPQLERAVSAVLDELRRHLGSKFEIAELAELYATDPDWASEAARSRSAGTDAVSAVDAAFYRYAREAADYGGGRVRPRTEADRPAEE